MQQTTPQSERADDQISLADLPCIAALLRVVRVLLGFGKQLHENMPEHAAHKHFPAVASGFGTYDIRRILAHVRRGILRAMVLERFLLACAAQGRDIDPEPQPQAAEAADIEGLDIKLRPPPKPRSVSPRRAAIVFGDLPHFSMPTLKALEAQVRRHSVGHTISLICMDLGVATGGCTGAFWTEIYMVQLHFGADLEQFYGTRTQRRESFEKKWKNYPENWSPLWRDRPREAFRAVMGYLLGEPPPPRQMGIPLAAA